MCLGGSVPAINEDHSLKTSAMFEFLRSIVASDLQQDPRGSLGRPSQA